MVKKAKADSMLTRFQGDDGRRRLVDLLLAQAVVGGDATIARKIAQVAVVRELLPGNILIEQKSAENDLFLILSGTFRVFVNGREVASRQAGQHVGEMVIIDPSLRRTATVIASEQSVVAQVDERTFSSLADKNPRLWRALAVELCHRLNERRKFHAEPNSKPILFIGSSKEHLAVAEALASGLPRGIASVTLWSDGVFGASKFPIEDLERKSESPTSPCSWSARMIGLPAEVLHPTRRATMSSSSLAFSWGRYRDRAHFCSPHGDTRLRFRQIC